MLTIVTVINVIVVLTEYPSPVSVEVILTVKCIWQTP